MRVFVTGATGLLGPQLIQKLLARGDSVVALTRSAQRAAARLDPRVEVVEGDPVVAGGWMAAIDGCDAVVNLAGEPIIDKPWSAAQKKRLLDSRVETTRTVVQAIREAERRPGVLISASAVGYYGDRGDDEIDESAPPATDFPGCLCLEWENAALPVEELGVRLVRLRIGIVLDRNGGALEKMMMPFKLFLGGPAGRPGQWVPWIHINDVLGLILFCLERDAARGPLNATAPSPVRLSTFSKALGRVLHRPSWLPLPPFVVRLALGERADLTLASQRVRPVRALELGYKFKHTVIEEALRSCLS